MSKGEEMLAVRAGCAPLEPLAAGRAPRVPRAVVWLVADCLQRAPSWSRTTTRPRSRSLPPWGKNAP